ncbi:hypothetical protein Q5P01_011453 [Channa striata]|uniref:Uncharacterized protein n=1 Tax=Channa striata TaxID=64152 RepID=A0AA88MUV2_CHASR|nr:hypothetical protein Q5P01_011453 [Channa striata]
MLMPVCACMRVRWDHRAGIVLACGEPTEIDLDRCRGGQPINNMETSVHPPATSFHNQTASTISSHQREPHQPGQSLQH